MALIESMSVNKWQHQQCLQVLRTLNSLRKSQTFCDVVLVVEDRRFSAHKVVLAASSPVFKASFTSELTQEKAVDGFEEVPVPDFDPCTVEELLNFVYTGEAGLTEQNALELLVAADYYDISNLKELCAEFLSIYLSPSNCLWIQTIAERYRHKTLHEAATDFICDNLSSIWETEEYLKMNFAEVKELFLSDERLAIKTQKGEEEVFNGLTAWVEYDRVKREIYFEELFRNIRLNSMSFDFLLKSINGDEFVSRNQECQATVTAALNLSDDERDEPRGVTESIVLLSRNGQAACYIPKSGTWFDLTRLRSYDVARAVTVCEGRVFAIGWEDERITIEKFDPRQNHWREVQNEFSSKPMAAVSLKDKIFILKEKDMTSFKPEDGSHEDLAHMNSIRRGLCAVALEGFIYTIGGYDGLQNLGLNSVEKYDPASDQWTSVAPMNELRCFASATVMGNKILVVGGTGDYCFPLSNCELYDPITNIWTLLPTELNVPRSEAAIAKAKKKVFVFGGTFSRGIVECYDEAREEWEEIGRNPSTSDFIHACVTWLPKTLVASIKGGRLFCVQQDD
ncbi:kelch-like protein diablo [Montipora foliosa]|uniref:kelch-like protein diablo n=1 Tax=Montipora foliosa TaxID=591990 RepID=UPI0035F12C39